jgi:AraC-like DNA-binding protein
MKYLNIYPTLKELFNEILIPKNWYTENFNKDFTMSYHTHSQFEIMYCAKGYFMLVYKSNPNTEEIENVIIAENHFIFINTGYYHKITIGTNGTKIYNIELEPVKHFPINTINPIENKFLLSVKELFSINKNLSGMREQNKPFYIFNDTQKILFSLKELISELNLPNFSDSNISIKLMVIKLLIDISHCSYSELKINTGFSYIKKALYYMKQNFQNSPKTKKIAEEAGVSASYLQILFKKELGKSIHNVLTEIKLENAKYLLETTGLSNSDIAKSSGLISREQLIYEFKKIEKCTPSEYRKKVSDEQLRHFSNIDEIEIK